METLENELSAFEKFLTENPGIHCELNEFAVSADTEPEGIAFLNTEQQGQFYRSYVYGKLKWRLKDGDEYDLRLTGSINMLPLHEINKDWKGIVYFDSTPENSLMRLFKPIDLFSDDACAGVYENDPEHLMHLYSYEGEPFNLKLSVDNYVLMALSFKGFYFWQYIIQYFIDGNPNEVVQDYNGFSTTIKGLPSVDELKSRYNQLKKP